MSDRGHVFYGHELLSHFQAELATYGRYINLAIIESVESFTKKAGIRDRTIIAIP